MQTRQAAVLASLRSVQKFLTDNSARLGDGITKSGSRLRLDRVIDVLDHHRNDQASHASAALALNGSQFRIHRKLVRDHMLAISRIARVDLPTTPEFSQLRMPSAKLGVERLAAAANSMADLASKYAGVFTDAGLPADFADQLRSAAVELQEMFTTRRNTRGARAGATTGLAKTLAEARRVVHVIDAFVETAFRDDAETMNEWRSVSRPRARAKTKAEPAAETVAAPIALVAATGSAAPAAIAEVPAPVPKEVSSAAA